VTEFDETVYLYYPKKGVLNPPVLWCWQANFWLGCNYVAVKNTTMFGPLHCECTLLL